MDTNGNTPFMKNPAGFKSVFYYLAAVVAVLFISSCGTTREFKPLKAGEETISSIDSVCAFQIQKGHFPGLAIAVASGKRALWTKGYGYANLEQNKPVDPREDLFRIGSISKSVSASALARLFERGEIKLDVPISQYYKGCPSDKGDLTLRQICGHLAGIRHYRGLEFLSNIHYENVIDPLGVFIHDSLLCKPGEQFNYSTYAWTLVSAVMEMAVHKPFTDIVYDEVNTPLHLVDLKPDYKDSTSFQRVTFYDYRDEAIQVSPEVDVSNKWAGGGFLCSAEDLAKFGLALTEPGYLKAETLLEFTRSQSTTDGKKTDNGIGFFSGTDDSGRAWFGHSGGSVGGTSMLLIYPQENLVVITLVNLSGAQMDGLATKIADIVLSSSGRK